MNRRRGILTILILLIVLGAGGPHAWAWYNLRSGTAELAASRAESAEVHLRKVLAIWPGHAEARLRLARAERQTGNIESAERELRIVWDRAGGSNPAIAFEWALLQAASGHASDVEEYLQAQSQADPARASLCWEAIVEGYIRVYRILDAVALIDFWLTKEPDNLRAIELRGLANMNGKGSKKAVEDFRTVLARDPSREATRWKHILCLLDMGTYDEAYDQLRIVQAKRPDDPEVEFRIARCQNLLGRSDEARSLLDGTLRRHPTHALALRTRGQFAGEDGLHAEAEGYYLRSIESEPNDHQTHFLLFQCLQKQGRTDDAQTQLKRANATRERAERMGELSSREFSIRPLDPDLHAEMGQLLFDSGNLEIAEKWLLVALRLDPLHRKAHTALADLYTRQGFPAKAAEHRNRP
jgi:tetratricopeptide (TPR) repeat protein